MIRPTGGGWSASDGSTGRMPVLLGAAGPAKYWPGVETVIHNVIHSTAAKITDPRRIREGHSAHLEKVRRRLPRTAGRSRRRRPQSERPWPKLGKTGRRQNVNVAGSPGFSRLFPPEGGTTNVLQALVRVALPAHQPPQLGIHLHVIDQQPASRPGPSPAAPTPATAQRVASSLQAAASRAWNSSGVSSRRLMGRTCRTRWLI